MSEHSKLHRERAQRGLLRNGRFSVSVISKYTLHLISQNSPKINNIMHFSTQNLEKKFSFSLDGSEVRTRDEGPDSKRWTSESKAEGRPHVTPAKSESSFQVISSSWEPFLVIIYFSLPLQEGQPNTLALPTSADAAQCLFLPVLAGHGVSRAHWLSVAITTYGKRGKPGEAVVGPGGEEEVEQIAETHRVPGRLVWRQVTARKVEEAWVCDADEVKEEGRRRWGNMKGERKG